MKVAADGGQCGHFTGGLEEGSAIGHGGRKARFREGSPEMEVAGFFCKSVLGRATPFPHLHSIRLDALVLAGIDPKSIQRKVRVRPVSAPLLTICVVTDVTAFQGREGSPPGEH